LAKAKAPAKRPDLNEEALLWEQGSAFVFGVDEAGRGCLAGPVSAGVSCWAPHTAAFSLAVDVRDSKLMTEPQREAAFEPILSRSLASGLGFATAAEIDRWNILRATYLAVARALEQALAALALKGIEPAPSLCAFLSDGNHPLAGNGRFFVGSPEYAQEFPLLRRLMAHPLRELCVVKGDSKVFSIATASVLAKVNRDRHMKNVHREFPAYNFSLHKGYGTPLHLRKLNENGPCVEHRRSFAPVSDTLKLFS
jgi:ribonuclease HII